MGVEGEQETSAPPPNKNSWIRPCEGSQNVAHSVTDYIGHAWMEGQSTKKVFGFKMSRFGRSLKAITISTLKFC